MRRDQEVRAVPERRILRQGFRVCDIDATARKGAELERTGERRIVDEVSPAAIHQEGSPWECSQELRIDKTPSRCSAWQE